MNHKFWAWIWFLAAILAAVIVINPMTLAIAIIFISFGWQQYDAYIYKEKKQTNFDDYENK